MSPARAEIRALGGEGVLNEQDLADFNQAELRIMELMEDGKWHSAQTIIEVSRQREGLRRLRSIRAKGFKVNRKRPSGPMDGRNFFYQLELP